MKTIIEFESIEFFTTRRLAAKKLQYSDLDKLRLMNNNPEVMRTLGGCRSEERTVENMNWNLKQWEDNGIGLWMFYLKESSEWIGRGGLRWEDLEGAQEVAVSYALMPKFWNQGFATEIAKVCVEIAFEVIKLDYLVGFTLATNKASRRVMEKVGFKYEREIIRFDQPSVLYRLQKPIVI